MSLYNKFNYLINLVPSGCAVVAEWLRRLTRNQIPFGSVGSNPTSCEFFFSNFIKLINDHHDLEHY